MTSKFNKMVKNKYKLEWHLIPAGNFYDLWDKNVCPAWIPARVYHSGADTYHAYIYDRKGNVLAWDTFLELDKAKKWSEKTAESSGLSKRRTVLS